MQNVIHLMDNPRFLVNKHSAEVDDFGSLAKDWDSQTLKTWLEVSTFATKHLGYHCQLSHSPEDVVMLCDMAVEMGWMVNITLVAKQGAKVSALPKYLSTQVYAVKTISNGIHKLYVRVELGQQILRCLIEEGSGVLVAGSTVEYPSWLQQVKDAVIVLGETDPERAFMAMASYGELYKAWESGLSPEEHVKRVASHKGITDLLPTGHSMVKQIMGIHPNWSVEYSRGYASFLAGVDLPGDGSSVMINVTEESHKGWSDARKIHELPL